MHRPVINSKFLLTLVQRGLAIIIVIILFILSSTLYFYHQINRNWNTQFYEKANFTIDQMEARFSNYINCTYIFQNNQKIQYLSSQSEKTFSYVQSTYVSEVSELIDAVSSPFTEISNICLYFPAIDLMVDRKGSSNLEVFQKYGNNAVFTSVANRDDNLQKVVEILQNSENYAESSLEIQTVGQNHYLILPGRRRSFIMIINDGELNRQLQGELFTEEALLEIYDASGTLFAKNYTGVKPEQSSRTLSLSKSGQSYGLQYYFDFNMLSYYEIMTQITSVSALACLAVVFIVVGILWSLKRRLYNPLNKLIKNYRLEIPQGTVHEYSLVENTFHKYDAISNELETMRSEMDQELEGYAINQLMYEYGESNQTFSPKITSYCVVVADFETNAGEKDVESSKTFYERLSGHFHIVKILSSTFSDVYMVPVQEQERLNSVVSAALQDVNSSVSICGISDCLTGIRQLKAAYRQAQRALWENRTAQRSFICFSNVRDAKPSATPLYSEQETKFLNSVLSHNYKDMEEYYEQLVMLYQNSNLERRHKLLLHLYDLLCIILTNEQINPDEFFNEVSSQFSESILSSCNIDYLTRQLRICYQKYVLSHTEDKDTLLKMMTDFIDQNINRNISLQELADEMHLSYSYMGRYFRSHMDMGFVEYVQLRKITLAQDLLLNTQMNLSEIAEKTGFTTVNSFFRTFKKIAGITPTQYRNQNR